MVVNTEPKSEGTPKITVKRKPFKPDLKPVKPIKAPIELGPLKIPSQFDAFK